MIAGTRLGRRGAVMVAAGITAAFLVSGCAFLTARNPGYIPPFARGSIGTSAYIIDSNITIVSFAAPGFTWSEPVTFNFTINSTEPALMQVDVRSDVLQPYVNLINVTVGLNHTAFTLEVNPLGLPGIYIINITFSRGPSSVSILHEIWLGSNPILSYTILFGTLGFVLTIYAKVGAPKKPKASSSSSPSGTGTAASAADDETSTVTYVDQSQAPPSRIFCPECKKVIEEGSIFCPECGTRIPRYLRYHP